jgi:hypothetical protein
MNRADIDRIFDSHPPLSEHGQFAHREVTEAFKALAMTISNLPEGRERAIVMTKLEEASFFAHAAIGRAAL